MESADALTLQILSSIYQSVNELVPSWYGPTACLSERLPDLVRNRHSFMVRFEVRRKNGDPVKILGKIPTYKTTANLAESIAHPVLRNNAFRQFEWLAGIRQVFAAVGADEEFCLIRPLGYLADTNAIIMEEIDGKTLKSIIPRPLISTDIDYQRFDGYLRQCGKWLRIFHDQMGSLEIEPYPTEVIRRRIQETLCALAEITSGAVAVSALQSAFSDILIELAGRPVAMSMEHGDMQCSNILVDHRARVGPIDPEVYERGPIYADLATLITDPVTRKNQVFSHGLYRPSWRLRQIEQACLRGYFGGQPYDRPVLGLHCALACAQKWLLDEQIIMASSGASANAARSWRPVMRHYFEQVIRGYLNYFSQPT
jgi:hypothetical protein